MSARSPNLHGAIERSHAALGLAGARCTAVSERIYEAILQELSAVGLSLGAAMHDDDLPTLEREALQTRARTVQQCARLLAAVAERLSGLDSPEGTSPASAGPRVRAGGRG